MFALISGIDGRQFAEMQGEWRVSEGSYLQCERHSIVSGGVKVLFFIVKSSQDCSIKTCFGFEFSGHLSQGSFAYLWPALELKVICRSP